MERKMRAIMRQNMMHKEKAVKTDAWSTELEGRVGHGDEKVGEKRGFRDVCDTGGGGAVAAAQGPHGEGGGAGGEKLENKRKKEDKHKQGGFEGQEKEKTVEQRKRPVSEAVGTARQQQQGGVCVAETGVS
jgi:hypothetical protein